MPPRWPGILILSPVRASDRVRSLRLRPDLWLLGLPALLALWAGTVMMAGPRLESELRAGVARAEVERAGGRAPGSFRVALAGRDVRIVADPDLDEAGRDAARLAALAVPGIRRAEVAIAAAAPLQPFVLAAEKRGASVTLTGGVPAGGVRGALVRRLGEGMPVVGIDDRLDLASGEPAGFAETASTLMALVPLLAQGRAEIRDRAVSVSGEAADPAAYRRLREAAALPPPAGFTRERFAVVPPVVAGWHWAATRDASGIVLSGFVPSEADRAAILAGARVALPGTPLTDRMDTARGGDGALDLPVVAAAILPALAELDGGEARLVGRTASVAGVSPARDLKGELWEALRAALPAGGATLGALEVRAVPARPYRLDIRRGDKGLSVAGFVPDNGARTALMERLRRDFASEPVSGRLRLADGAPDGFGEAVAAGLGPLREMRDGRLALRDAALSLDGTVLYPGLARRLSVAPPLPAGWRSAVSVGLAPGSAPLDRVVCADLLNDAIRRDPVRFEGASPAPGSALDALGAILRRCGSARVAVQAAVVSPDPDAAAATARSRAAALVASLAALAPDARLVPRGTGRAGSPDSGTTRFAAAETPAAVAGAAPDGADPENPTSAAP